MLASAVVRGEFDSPVALPPASDPPSGIWTLRRGPRGLAPPAALPTLTLPDCDGGVRVVSGIDDKEPVRSLSSVWVIDRCGTGGDLVALPALLRAPTSIDWARAALAAFAAAAAAADSFLTDSLANDARCWDRMDLFSSIGVKMLCDFR